MRSKLPLVILVFLAVASIFFCLFTPTFAQGNVLQLENPTGRKLDAKERVLLKAEELRAKQEENREKIAERRQEVKEEIATKRAEIHQKVIDQIKTTFGRILTRYEAALSRFDKLIARIESRIGKLKEKGVDTSAGEVALTNAKVQLTEAVNAVALAEVQVEAIDPASPTKDAVHQAVAAVRSAKKEIIDVHQALAKTVKELKAAIQLRTATESAKGGTESAQSQ